MITKVYWINEEAFGDQKLGIMARPRGNDWLEDEIKWLGIRGVDCLVSLLERHEAKELGLGKEAVWCEQFGIKFINYPIEDVNLPASETDFITLLDQLCEKLDDQKKVVIHCRMGIGRSSVLAGGIMIRKGIPENEVFDIISRYREMEVPDTEEQKQWLLNTAHRIRQYPGV